MKRPLAFAFDQGGDILPVLYSEWLAYLIDKLVMEVWDLELLQTALCLHGVPRQQVLFQQEIDLGHMDTALSLRSSGLLGRDGVTSITYDIIYTVHTRTSQQQFVHR